MILIDATYRMIDGEPVIVMYGSTSNGSRVVNIKGFRPYCYVLSSDPAETISYAEGIGCRADIVMRRMPVGYQSSETPVVRIEATNPLDIRMIRDDVRMLPSTIEVFDADIPFRTRFLIDKNVYGMHWYDITGNEIDISQTDMRGSVPEWFKPERDLSILCFDIECLTDGRSLPTPDRFPVIIISISINKPERMNGLQNVLLVLASPENIDHINTHVPFANDSLIVPCISERQLLQKFVEIISSYDPDIVTGYNINAFDFPYIMTRAEQMGVPMRLGRDGSFPKINPDTDRVTVTGRVVIDLLPLVRKNYKLQRYNLETAARDIVGDEKHDIEHSKISEMWLSNGVGRLIDYAIQDAVITKRILLESGMLEKYVALAQLTGNLLQDIIDGGQTIMIEMAIMREFFKEGRMVSMKPERDDDDEEGYKGAYVLDPAQGLIEDVIILDFKSLYPTIMISHNLCYSTIVAGEKEYSNERIRHDDLIHTINNTSFVKHKIYTGIVPRILTRLLDERIKIKKLMKSASDEDMARLDAKQYALKILLNSFYGYTGYRRSRLYCSDIASTVTAIGRYNLEHTKRIIEEMSNEEYQFRVVYGDTDSVFVHIKTKNGKIDPENAKRIGEQIAAEVTKHLPSPMELVYEAYAKRGVFLSKKRYAMYLPEDGKIKIRGIETVRRDWCPLVSNMLNKCLKYILVDDDIDAAVRHVRETIRSLYHIDRETMNQITLTRTYTKDMSEYKNIQPHVYLARKMQSRGEYVPSVGDRISYVITTYGRSLSEKAEDPEYVMEHNIPIDIDYYIHKQLLPPAHRLLKHFGVSADMLQHEYMTNLSSKSSEQRAKTTQLSFIAFVQKICATSDR